MSRLAFCACLALLSAMAVAAPITYITSLSGANENPAVVTAGTGFASATIDTTAHTLIVSANFSGLTGTTTVSHIHCCVDAPGNVGVAIQAGTFAAMPVGVTAGSFTQTLDLTLTSVWGGAFLTANGGTAAGAEAALAAGLASGRAYFNLHTTFRPGGEIRGFLATPEPSTFALAGGALLGLAALRRRK